MTVAGTTPGQWDQGQQRCEVISEQGTQGLSAATQLAQPPLSQDNCFMFMVTVQIPMPWSLPPQYSHSHC